MVNQPGIELEVYGEEPRGFHWTALVRRLVGKIGKIISPKIAGDFWVYWKGRWIDPSLPKNVDRRQPTVVMTVAHGDGFMAAMRFAKKRNLPLISFFQDWWPDIAAVHGFAKRRIEKEFLKLAAKSATAICISEGMKRALGSPACVVLPALPSPRNLAKTAPTEPAANGKFKLLYSGNLGEYGPMLGEALTALDGNEQVELIVRGARPDWSLEFARKMREQGKWLDFAPRAELEAWLESADAFLVPMVFDAEMRRRMQTSFPSKLIEFAQFGKPLVVWGPDYCSAVEWARQRGAAASVTEPDVGTLVRCFEELASSRKLQERISSAAKQAAQQEFNPEEIQKTFCVLLNRVLVKQTSRLNLGGTHSLK